MQIIKSDKAQFEYDIHALVKAFYPEWNVKILTPESVIKDKRIRETAPVMELMFGEKEVVLRVYPTAFFSSKIAAGGAAEGLAHKAEDGGKEEEAHIYRWEQTDKVPPEKYKDSFKRFLYLSLQEETGISLPWGNLTGIRPTKIALTMLKEGIEEKAIGDFLKKEHFVSDERAALGIEIAKRERKILHSLHDNGGYSLYIGIPFCPTTCLYCSFTSYPIHVWQGRVADYLTALEKEMTATAKLYAGKVPDTVYIGGGTPTSLSAKELARLLESVNTIFDMSRVREFTVEAGRADSITAEKLRVLAENKVTRISVNPQTMRQETLKLIGRQHTVGQVEEAFYLARKAGFDNINMDIILGLPKEDEKDVAFTIEAIKKLLPDSLTVHSLAVKRASKLNEWIEKNGVTAYNNTEETMRIAAQGAREMGMVPYYLYRQKNMSGNFENVGYAREGKYGIYNILIMEEVQTIVALGAGSITKRVSSDGRGGTQIARCENVKEVGQYIDRIDEMIERKKRLFEG